MSNGFSTILGLGRIIDVETFEVGFEKLTWVDDWVDWAVLVDAVGTLGSIALDAIGDVPVPVTPTFASKF